MKTLNLRKRLLSKKSVALCSVLVLLFLMLGSSTTALSQEAGDDPAVEMIVTRQRVRWVVQIEHGGVVLTVAGPGGVASSRTFEPGQTPVFRLADANGDGSYTYELLILPADDGNAPPQVDDAQRGLGDDVSPQAIVLSGGFTILDGTFVTPAAEEGTSAYTAASAPLIDGAAAGQLIVGDLIVQGSECIGVDCISSESFGFDTLRLKENNLRIKFQDTSNSASFPTNDWQITANDSSNGGASKFSIDDIDSGRTPFTIEAGTRANALYVDDSGRVGLGTSTPAEDLHIWYGDTPTIRLHQSGSGWAPQTWDIAGNEANFFIRDVTNGSNLPFRIKPGAPTDSIFIANDGDIGLGTDSPEYPLEIERTGANAQIAVERTSGATAKFGALTNKTVFGSVTNHPTRIVVNNAWVAEFETSGDLTMEAGGEMNATAFNPTSDVNAKENFAAVDGKEVLEQLEKVEITTWNFKGDDARHIGPTAQGFWAAYGLGRDNKHISTTDADGVALAAIKELDAQNEALKEENANLEARVATLEQVAGLSAEPQVSILSVLPWILVGILLVGLGLLAGFALATRKQLNLAKSQ